MELREKRPEEESSICRFDSLCTTPSIQQLKILTPILPRELQGYMAMYIKYLELTYTRKLFFEYKGLCFHGKEWNLSQLCKEMEPYCNSEQINKIRSIQGMYEQFNNIQEMMGMMDMMKEIFPDGFASDASSMNMDEILNMANMFGGMNGST